jgi:hypothetical protein
MIYNQPILKIPNATETTKDAAQYMLYRGVKQYNLCGQFCVAYCMGDEANTDNIDDFLKYWEAVAQPWWKTVFNSSNLARTTGIFDLSKMLSAYNAYYMPWSKIPVNMNYYSDILNSHQAIIGVKIDHTGYLVGSGIPHWVVLDGISIMDNNHAIVDIFNPFTNQIEPYSWRELMTSTGGYKQGLWIER